MVDFPTLPSNLRVPLAFVEVDMSLAASGGLSVSRSCIVGQRLSGGTVAEGVPTRIRSGSEADEYFGAGSLLARACRAYLLNDAWAELWGIALDDASGSVAAQGRITVSGTATESGVISLWIAGMRLAVPVEAGATATEVAAAIVAAVADNPQLPVTAANSSGVVTFTARNKGTLGNAIDLRWNYRGALGGEVLPAGITLALTARMGGTTAGATDPDVGTAITAMADVAYDFVASPYHDADNLAAWEVEFDGLTGRWSWSRPIYGGVFSARAGTVGARETWGLAQNDPHHYVLGYHGDVVSGGVHVGSPTPVWEVGAAWMGCIAAPLREDPSTPVMGRRVRGVYAPPEALADTIQERNTMLYSGISTGTANSRGELYTEKVISTYQVNALDAPDDSWLDVQTAYTVARMNGELRSKLRADFLNFKLVDVGTPIAAGQRLVSTLGLKAWCVSQYLGFQRRGWVENLEAFQEHLVVQRNADNPRRIDLVFPPDLTNPLDVFGVLMQPRLQYAS